MEPGVLRLSEKDGGVRFEVRAKPRARKSGIAGVREGALEVSLAAPPVNGAANAELVEVLARTLGVRRADVVIARGEGSRVKMVEVRGLGAEDVRRRLVVPSRTKRE